MFKTSPVTDYKTPGQQQLEEQAAQNKTFQTQYGAAIKGQFDKGALHSFGDLLSERCDRSPHSLKKFTRTSSLFQSLKRLTDTSSHGPAGRKTDAIGGNSSGPLSHRSNEITPMNLSFRSHFFGAVLWAGLSMPLLASAAPSPTALESMPVKVDGELEVFFVDHSNGSPSGLQYFIRDKQTNRRYRIQPEGDQALPRGLRAGSQVRVHGQSDGNTIFAPAIEFGSVEPASTNSGALLAPMVSGEQRTVVLVANFDNQALTCSMNEIQDLMFTDPGGEAVADYYQDTSHSNIYLSGETHGPYSIPAPNDCSAPFSAYTDALDASALADGVDVSLFDRRIYVMPNTGCGYAGVGSVGNTPSQSLIFTCSIADVYAHELGHNFGMYHASTANSEYGDKTGIMGISNVGLRHLNSAHQNEMGWRSPAMNVLVSASGTFDIAPQSLQEAQAVAPQILRVAKPDTNEYYYVAYRRPIGFDQYLEWWHQDIVTVHRYQGAGGAPTNTFLVGELGVGGSFNDAINGITISHLSQTPDYATVQISLGGGPAPVCSLGTPTVSVSPANQSGLPGDTLAYSVSITNTDSADCAASTFTLSDSLPSGWNGALSSSEITLSPSKTGGVTLTVSSPNSATADSYPLVVDVVESGVASHSASTNASYVITDSCAVGIPTLSLSPSSQSGDPGTTLAYTVTLANTDSAACDVASFNLTTTLPQGWSGSAAPQQIDLAPGASGQAILSVTSPATATAGSYGLGITASDSSESAHETLVAGSYSVNSLTPSVDSEAPSTPTGLSANANQKQVVLSWNASSDDTGVLEYRVYRDGTRLASTATNGYTDKSGADGVTYAYTVDAVDAAGNASAQSAAVNAGKTTKGGGGGSNGGGNGKGPTKK